MASGMKELVINNQERAVSADVNRLQKFKSKDIAEMWRHMIEMNADEMVLAGSVAPSDYNTPADPLEAGISTGLMVTVTNAALTVGVTSGQAWIHAGDPGADDSTLKYVRDLGTTSLSMTANSSGSIRVDVIECQIDATATTLNASRDIFDSTTGLFSATSVLKETQLKLTYRVRLGTPGAGFPGTASGWLPLAVASVPTGTTTNDTITFWDVRPMIADRVIPPFNRTDLIPHNNTRANFIIDNDANAGTESRMSGWVEAHIRSSSGRGSYRYGGTIRAGVPLTDTGQIYINVRNTVHHASGFVVPVSGTIYFYLAAPYGLPRWARYITAAEGTRVPRSPRGIFVVTNTPPLPSGKASANFLPPTSTGFVTAIPANDTICVGSCRASSSAIQGGINDGRVFWLDGSVPVTPFVTIGVATIVWRFTPHTDYPANAKALYINFAVNFQQAATSGTLIHSDLPIGEHGLSTTNGFAYIYGATASYYNPTGGAATASHDTGVLRIPIRNNLVASDAAVGVEVSRLVNLTSTSLNVPDCLATIVGWEFGEG